MRMGVQRGLSGEPRTVRILKALAAASDGLTTAELIDVLGENIRPPKVVRNLYGTTLSQLESEGLVVAARKPPGPGPGGPPRNIWRITRAGNRNIAERKAAPARIRQADRMLDGARALFGAGTPPGLRREAAIGLRDARFNNKQIGTVFGVTATTIHRDLQGARPGLPVQDVIKMLDGIARRGQQQQQGDEQQAELARKAVRAAGQQLGPGMTREIRREAAGILRDLGVSLGRIGTAFGVTGETIRLQLAGRPPGLPARDPLRVIGDLADRAEHARQELRRGS
jgi:hypothetical protein